MAATRPWGRGPSGRSRPARGDLPWKRISWSSSVIGISTPRSRAWSWTLRVVGHPLGDVDHAGEHLVERLAPADPLADRAVAAERAVAGRDHVADAGQAVERRRARPPGRRANRVISTRPAGQQGRLGIIAEARGRRRSPRRSPGCSSGPRPARPRGRRGWCRRGTSPGSGRRGPRTQSHSSSPATTTEAGIQQSVVFFLCGLAQLRYCSSRMRLVSISDCAISRSGDGMRLPRRGVVLADPGLGEAQLVGPAQRLQIPAMAVAKAALRRVRRHREQTVLHGSFLCARSNGRDKRLIDLCRCSRNGALAGLQ